MKRPRFTKRWFVPAPPVQEVLSIPAPVSTTVAYALDHADPDMETRPRILITALGSGSPSVGETINATCSIAFTDGLFPIVVGSALSTDFLVNAPMPIETLPMRADLHVMRDLEYRQYIERRWTIILGKWGISETLDLAQDVTTFVNTQLTHDIAATTVDAMASAKTRST